jgi:SAM-dependent methyltransferase
VSRIRTFLQRLGTYLLWIGAPLKTADRHFLETIILPWIAAMPGPLAILFVGVRFYTARYPDYFHAHAFHTIDLDVLVSAYGAGARHVTGDATELTKYYTPGSFDVVFLNGVIGYGMNAKGQVERFLEEGGLVLKPGGLLVIGWNNLPERLPCALEDLSGLQHFAPFRPPFSVNATHRFETDTQRKHVFDFYTSK